MHQFRDGRRIRLPGNWDYSVAYSCVLAFVEGNAGAGSYLLPSPEQKCACSIGNTHILALPQAFEY